MNDLISLSTLELAAGIREGRFSSSQVLDAHLERIETYNPALNAVVTLDAHGARARARAADQALARGEVWGPLHGVPFTLKDALATAGMRTTTGFPPLQAYVPPADSTVAARLKAAGGILIGKTNVAMLLADYQTANPIFGRTNNPWDLARTPGGSSGGAAAALAAGMTPFEMGTDLSGSIRIPAAFCGVFGLKPTERRVSLIGVVPGLDSPRSVRIMSSVGPLARTLDDLELLYGIVAGPDGMDTEVPPVSVDRAPAPEMKALRIAYASTFPGVPAAAEIRAAVEAAAAGLSRLGARVEEAKLPALDFTQDLMRTGEMIGMLTGVFQPEQGQPPIPLARYLEALEGRDRSILAWERFFQDWDALLCPASAVTAFPHCDPGTPLTVDGQETSYWMVSAHTALFNYTGHPAVVLPYRQDQAGLPIGVQLVGKRWNDSGLLSAAKAVTQVTGAFQPPP
jgi:amidase